MLPGAGIGSYDGPSQRADALIRHLMLQDVSRTVVDGIPQRLVEEYFGMCTMVSIHKLQLVGTRLFGRQPNSAHSPFDGKTVIQRRNSTIRGDIDMPAHSGA